MKKIANPISKTETNTNGDAQRFTLRFTREQFAVCIKLPGFVVKQRLDKPIESEGIKHPWLVHPVRLTPDGKLEQLGLPIRCRDETEANEQQAIWIEHFKQAEARRKLDEAERPIPGRTLGMVGVAKTERITTTGIPLSQLLAQPKSSSISSATPPPDAPFVAVGNVYWKGGDGSSQAMKAAITQPVHTVEAFRLVHFTEPIQNNGCAFPYGIEFAEFSELSLQSPALRVMERRLCATEEEGRLLLKQTEKEAQKRLDQILNKPAMTAEELKEEADIRDIQAMAKSPNSSPEAKARHNQRINEIRETQSERVREAAAVTTEQASRKAAEIAAFNILMDDNFPSLANVMAELKKANAKPTPEHREKMRRAMKIDCARLGIPSPFNQFVMDDKFTVEVTKALKSKSPFKPAQHEAVLNWWSKKYESMKEDKWTALVVKEIKTPVNKAGLGKTLSKKFRLKSKLKGRPETESGKTSEG